jgi:hypothetical protein
VTGAQVRGILVALAMTVSAHAQTAREYYEELRDADGLNRLATLVCFPNEETGSFAIVGLSSQFAQTLRTQGLPIPPAIEKLSAPDAVPYLWWQGFAKGVPAEPWILDRPAGSVAWSLGFKEVQGQKVEGLVSLTMNFQTLRYELDVRIGAERDQVFGRCHAIR